MVLSGLEWSRLNNTIKEAIKHQNRTSEPSTITNVTTGSGQTKFEVDIESSKVVFVRTSGRRPKMDKLFEISWSAYSEKKTRRVVKWSLSGQQVVLSGLEWSKLIFST